MTKLSLFLPARHLIWDGANFKGASGSDGAMDVLAMSLGIKQQE